MKIYYVGFYDFQDAEVVRECWLSAINKMTYITKVLQEINPDTEIVSISLPEGNRFFYPHTNIVKDGIKVHFLPFSRLFSHHSLKDRWRCVLFFLHGLFHFTSNDVVISYHSPSYVTEALVYLRNIKKIKLILEVEEIYADVITRFASALLKRETYAFENCDGYIFSTEMLANKINDKKLPSVVIYGTYQQNTQPNLRDDDFIHVVYAGTFDHRKGGVIAAVKSVSYLPKNYFMHICGFGTEDETESIKSLINSLKDEGNNIQYEGLLKGADYLNMLHKCQIGLSTQNPSAKFNNTSFPSKILSYMSAGLAVVSINIPAVEGSKVGKYISFYDSQTPEEIAKSIMRCDISQGERNKDVIASLNADFQRELERCIQRVMGERL